ncbi:MAG: DUF1439 domain-containing protein [Proteobacteria bacterium]|nr:DUF1439 domain-containing protein [Pseudomonadota bacterium]
MRLYRRSLLGAAFAGACSALVQPLPAWGQSITAPPGATPMAATWPHTVTVNGATVTIYEPQAIDWANHTTLRARAAVAITPVGSQQAILGTIEISGATEVDKDEGIVYFSQPTLVSSSFPSLDTSHAYQLQTRIAAFLARMPPKIIPLNTVLLSLNEPPVAAVPVDNTPPTIFYSAQPASLLVFDGKPVTAPIGSTGLTFAVNTNWTVIHDSANGGTWYLLNNGSWLVAQDYAGPYEPAGPLPPAFSQIPADADFGAIRKSVPGKPLPAGSVPIVFVSTKPAEIIVTAGPPHFQPVPGTSLDAVTNTGAVLFRYAPNKSFYYLVSGRWFSAASLYGPWTFATPNLPADFARLSPDGSYGNLLASVPGTAEAQAAVLKAQIPTQATLSRKTATVTVTYAGAPNFVPIPGTSLRYATNTAFQVIDVGGLYYVCYEGAWFVGHSPNGPWTLATSVPAAIYAIPPTSPLYNVTYVQVYGATPTAVTYGFTSGYLLGFVTAGVICYGTGYYYPPYVVPGRVPGYFPYPYSYAGNVHYNTATGAWASTGTVYGPYGRAATGGSAYNPNNGAYTRGGAVYGPNGGAGAWSRYNPSTGTYSHGSASWNNGSGTAYASAYNPTTGRSGSTTQNANPYARWGSSTVSGPNGTVNTASGSNARGSAGGFNASNGAQGAAVHGAGGNNAGAVKTASGNVYAGADGNAYKKTDSGWQKYNNGSWQSVQPPSGSQARSTAQTNHPSSTAPSSRQTTGASSGYQRPSTSSYQRPSSTATTSTRQQPRMDSNSWGQLNRDQTARQSGGYNRGSYGGGAARGGGGFRRAR